MTDKKIYILASDEVADKCMSDAVNWHTNQSKFHDSTDVIGFAVAVVGEYLANKKGFTMYTDKADYPKDKK